MTARQTSPAPRPRLYVMAEAAQPALLAAPLAQAQSLADVAAVLLRLPAADARTRINIVKDLAPAIQSRDAAVLVEGDADLVARAGADGAHLASPAALAAARALLTPKWIAGCGGLRERHDAMVAAETGADYVMFGEPDAAGHRPSFAAIRERVAWWAEVFETPCVGYAADLEEVDSLVTAGADFIAVGPALWSAPRAMAALGECLARSRR